MGRGALWGVRDWMLRMLEQMEMKKGCLRGEMLVMVLKEVLGTRKGSTQQECW
jgi:hypothetical protein